MNIKSRIKRIEQKAVKSFSAFCLCYGENLKYEVVPITIDERKRRRISGEERYERLPDVCGQCGNPVDKSRIETTFEQFKETRQRRINELINRLSSYEVS